jgi:hypothetical protein
LAALSLNAFLFVRAAKLAMELAKLTAYQIMSSYAYVISRTGHSAYQNNRQNIYV